jgi:hypothetical protein
MHRRRRVREAGRESLPYLVRDRRRTAREVLIRALIPPRWARLGIAGGPERGEQNRKAPGYRVRRVKLREPCLTSGLLVLGYGHRDTRAAVPIDHEEPSHGCRTF